MRKFVVTGNAIYSIGIQVTVESEDSEMAKALITQELHKKSVQIDFSKLTFNTVDFKSAEEIN